MGLDFRKRTGRIANGSRLIVPGQPTTGVKVFSPSFKYKVSAPRDNDLLEQILPFLTPTPTPTPTPSSSPQPTPTPTVTPTNTPTNTPTQTVTPTPTVTPTNTPTNTPTPTVTPTPSPNYDAYLPVELSLDTSLPNLNCSIWYSYMIGPYNPTQPYPPGLTWTKLGVSQVPAKCNNYTLFGQIGLLTGQSVYIQVRSGTNTVVLKSLSLGLNGDPCGNSGPDLFTTSFTYSGGLIVSNFQMKVIFPLTTNPTPF